jgi:hypothetical protein
METYGEQKHESAPKKWDSVSPKYHQETNHSIKCIDTHRLMTVHEKKNNRSPVYLVFGKFLPK